MKHTALFLGRISAACILATAFVSLQGCDRTCTAIDEAATTDPLTSAEQAAIDANAYFNLTGDCDTDEVACEELLPDSCEDACSAGFTCTQVALTVDPCGGNPFFPDVDPGDHWIRKCLEVENSSQANADGYGLEDTGEARVRLD
jgi:hypothetical protein